MTTDLEYVDDERPELVKGPWRPETEQDADWAMRRRGECEAEIEEIERQFDAALAMLTARKEELVLRSKRGIAFFTAALTDYSDRNRGALLKGKRKSHDFLHGRISWRSTAERLEVTDRDALAAWLSAQPVESGLYRVEVKPEMRALQDHYKATGEVPPGCDVKPATEEIRIDSHAPERVLKGGS